jgi:hypothetical protein
VRQRVQCAKAKVCSIVEQAQVMKGRQHVFITDRNLHGHHAFIFVKAVPD